MNQLIKTLNSTALGLVITLLGIAHSPAAFAKTIPNWGMNRDHDRSADRDHRWDSHRSVDKSRAKHRRTQSKQHKQSRPSSKHRNAYDKRRSSHYRYDHRRSYPRPYRRDWHQHNYRYYFPLSDFIKFFAVAAITFKVLDILSEDQRRKHEQAMSRAMDSEVGDEITWEDEDDDVTGTVTPTRNGVNAHGQPCREFQQTVTIGGKTQQAYGTACRQPDGSWQIVQ